MENLFSEENKAGVGTEQKVKNLTALSIILGGLFLGSLFIDFVQLATGEGFSSRIVKNFNVLETAGKTWVGYGDPKVSVQVITDKDCQSCNPNEALVWLRRVIPTLEATRMDVSEEATKKLVERFGITSLPAFVFSKDVLHTSFYSQASSLFRGEGQNYFFEMTKIGLPVGKYLTLPKVEAEDVVFGSEDAKVTIIEFSDFQCEFCKTFHKDLMQTVAGYGDQVRFVYKSLPLSFHDQAENAALAAYCAHEQGKFTTYTDYLFTKQNDWSVTSGTQKFKDYAWWLRLDGRKFTACMDNRTYSDKVKKDKEEATQFSVNGTPGTFINGTFLSGAVDASEIKQAIEKELSSLSSN